MEEQLTRADKRLDGKATPSKSSYYELTPEEVSHYQSLIGMLKWITQLERIYIYLEEFMMALCASLPRDVHLEQVYHIFGFSNKHHNTELVFDPSTPDAHINDFKRQDQTTCEFVNLLESDKEPERPANLPASRCFRFIIRGKVDYDHAVDAVTSRIRTGFIVYLNSSPTCWLSKKQNSV